MNKRKLVHCSANTSSPAWRLIFKASLFVLGMLCGQTAFAQASLSTSFTQNTIGPGSVSTLTYTITNNGGSRLGDAVVPNVPIGANATVTGLSFTNTLPSTPGPLTIATPANLSSTCDAGPSGSLTAPDGGSTVTLSGYQVGAGQSCTISVDVTASTLGMHTNPAVTLTSSSGSSMSLPTNLTVVATLPGFSKSFTPSTVPFGDRSRLTFTIDNTLNASRIGSLRFTDNLPAGMVIADPARPTTDCVSATAPDTILTAVSGSNVLTLQANGNAFFPGFEVLAANGTCTVSVDVTTVGVGQLNNISSDLLVDFIAAGKASATLNVTRTDLSIQKSFTNDPVPPGSSVTLQFTLNNFNRSFSATDVTFTDDLTALTPSITGLTFSSLLSNDCGSGSSVTGVGGTTIGLTGGTISAEGSCTISVSLSVSAGTTPGVYTNTTSAITGTVDGSSVVGNMASDNLHAEPVPLLTKEFLTVGTLAPNPIINAGDDVVLRFTITNPSTTSAATDIAFLDELTDGGLLTGFLPFPVSVTLPSVPNPACGSGSALSLVLIDTDRQGLKLTGGSLAAAPGAGSSCTFDVTLTVPAGVGAGKKTNTTGAPTATIDGATRTGSPASDDLTVIAAPKLSKSFTDDPVAPGSSVTLEFKLVYSANASGDATAITFTDDLAALAPALAGLAATGLPLSAACDPDGAGGKPGTGTLTGSVGNTLLTFAGATLSPGESCTVSVTLAVPAATASGTYTNTTSGVSATVAGIATSSPAANAELVVGSLLFSKKFLSTPVLPGEALTLRFSLENINSVTATGIGFTDSLFPVAGLIATDPALVNSCGGTLTVVTIPMVGSLLTYAGGTLASGASCTVDVEVTVPATASDGSFDSATSVVSYMLGATLGIDGPAVDKLIIQSAGRLSLSKEFTNDPVLAGGVARLVYEIKNPDLTKSASAIAFTDNLGGVITGLEVSSLEAPSNCQAGGAAISGLNSPTFSVSTLSLAPGASCTIIALVTVPSGTAQGAYTSDTSVVTGNLNSFSVTGLPASDDLTVANFNVDFSKAFGASTATAGGSTTLEFTITNNDTTSLSRLSFTDNLNTATSGLSAVGLPLNDVCGTGSTISGTSTLSLIGGNLAGSASCTFSVNLAVSASAPLGVFSSTSSDLTESVLVASSSATANITIIPPVPLFSKVFSPELIAVNGVSKLTFTIDNTASTAGASGLDFVDNLPTGMVVATPANIVYSCVGGAISAVAGSSTISYSGGTVNLSSSCAISVDVTATVAATLINTTGDLTSSSGNSGTASDSLQASGATFSKSFSGQAPKAGGGSTLTFTIANLSASDSLGQLTFEDNLDSVLSGLTITTSLPANDVCGAGSVLSSTSSGLRLNGGNLAAGANCSFSVDLMIPANAAPGDYLNTTSNLLSMSLIVASPATDTLTIAPTEPSVSLIFTPSSVATNQSSVFKFTINNSATPVAAGALSVTNNFPSGLSISATPSAMTSCTGGTLIASAGSSTLSYTGGTVAASGMCSIYVKVDSALGGTYVNTTGSLTSTAGNSGTASATLTVDDDSDDDGVPNNTDNCPNIANPDQADLDKDNIGNACDNDSDNDLMPDDYERENGLDPFNSFDQQGDPDGDGFTNLQEYRFGSDPNVADTDNNNNGVPDSVDERRIRSIVPSILLPLLIDED